VNMRHADQMETKQQKSAGDGSNDKIKVSAWRNIGGLVAYTISACGTPRKWGREIHIDKGPGGLPVINVNKIELLLDEVVAWAFLGPPRAPLRAMTVVHFDGDDWNCQVDNLAWRVCPEWAEADNNLAWRVAEFERQARAIARPTKQRMLFFD
jgi:hypothetical protein